MFPLNPFFDPRMNPYMRFVFPFGGDVDQDFMNGWFKTVIKMGNPAIEAGVLANVASYGSQIGTLMDVLNLMAQSDSFEALRKDNAAAFEKLETLHEKVEEEKEKHRDVTVKDIAKLFAELSNDRPRYIAALEDAQKAQPKKR